MKRKTACGPTRGNMIHTLQKSLERGGAESDIRQGGEGEGRDESAPAPPGITRDGSCEAWGPLARDLDTSWPGKMFFLLNPAYDVVVQGPVWANPLCA